MSTAFVLVGLGPGPTAGLRIELAGDQVEIGRSSTCQIRLTDAHVAQRHATMRIRDGRLWVQDLGGFGGTFVNGQRLGGAPYPLGRGDVIVFGTVALRYETVGSDAPAPAQSEPGPDPQPSLGAGRPHPRQPPEAVRPRRWCIRSLLSGALCVMAALALLVAVLDQGGSGSLLGLAMGGAGLLLVSTGMVMRAAAGPRARRSPPRDHREPGTRHTAATRGCR